MKPKYTPVIQKHGPLYVAYVEELPGVKTQGRTPAEARRNLEEVMTRVTKSNREFAARSRSRVLRRRTE